MLVSRQSWLSSLYSCQHASLSSNFVMLTLQQSLWLCCGHKSWKSATQIMSPTFMICKCNKVCGLCRRLSLCIVMD